MKLLLIILSILKLYSHDVQVATYDIYEDNEHLIIEFVFENDDILYTFSENKIDLKNKSLQKYILENFSISINGSEMNLSFGDMLVEENHIFVQGEIANINDEIKTVEITNTCLVNIEDHSNIIELKFHKKQRDFLMNMDRTSIVVNY